MTALAHEPTEAAMPHSELDEALWSAWRATVETLPEGFHAEIIEGSIEVSPTGRYSHARVANRLRRALDTFLDAGEFAAYQDINVVHGRKVWIPDVVVAPEEAEEHVTGDGIGLKASAVEVVVEVVSPGYDGTARDRVRKRRSYARAGIPVYVGVDDYDDGGKITVLTSPNPQRADYAAMIRVPYGREATIPDGPAKGFVIGEAITGPARDAS